MRIVCLEQGDWVNQANYPSTGRDWESRAWADYAINPNIRKLKAYFSSNFLFK
jgi:hypothetical protein